MSRLDTGDTIAAIASPGGGSLMGMVRLTGPSALDVALTTFEHGLAKHESKRSARLVGRLHVEGLRRPVEASVSTWPGPRTYTGQDLAEIQTSGSAPVLGAVLAHCLGLGARPAEPGEFTLRAFLSGRIDLTQSEAVLGVIDARTPAQLDASLSQLAGGLASPIARVRDELADVLAHLEANLDFAEEPDVAPLARSALADSIASMEAEIGAMAARLRGRDRSSGRPRVVLVGPPNAGKSRLFNALTGLDRAIVSPVAGTTRDYLEDLVDCDGLAIDLVDTAGFEEVTDPAQSARSGQSNVADLLLECRSGEQATDRPRLRVWTKADVSPPEPGFAVVTSASTGEGLDQLRSAIAGLIRSRDADGLTSTSERCGDSLAGAARALASASETARIGGGDELVAVDLRQALDDLGRVVGAVITDDLLDRIFRRFCVGK